MDAGYVVSIPDRLEDGVGESLYQETLHRFLAKIMVDAKDLRFLKPAINDSVEFVGALQVPPEGFLNDYLGCRCKSLVPFCKSACPEVLENRHEDAGRRRNVEKTLGIAAQAFLDRGDLGIQLFVAIQFIVATGVEGNVRGKGIPGSFLNGSPGMRGKGFPEVVPKGLIAHGRATVTNQVARFGQKIIFGEIENGGG